MKHQLPNRFLTHRVVVHIVGAGGNGAQFANGMARLHMSMTALGHPGFDVVVFDPDIVTEANIGRQLFSPSDVGTPKAHVIVNRLNVFYQLNWKAARCKWDRPSISRYIQDSNIRDRSIMQAPDFVIGCVDSAPSRLRMEKTFDYLGVPYWLDMGNDAKTGQIILGSSKHLSHRRDELEWDLDTGQSKPKKKGEPDDRLPTVMDLFPSLRTAEDNGDDTPSCSLAGALQRQDLFINQEVATQALNLLWQFFRNGHLERHGVFVNIEKSTCSPLPIDPMGWARFGYYGGLSGASAPYRKVKKLLKKRTSFGTKNKLLLVCGHQAEGFGTKKARCVQCLHQDALRHTAQIA
jgi:PRTRC genetic system ThiF family protein